MDVYKTEEEQVQAIKQWWKENSTSLVAGVVIGIAVLAGYKYWTDSKQSKAQQASVIYEQLLSPETDKEKSVDILKNDYSGTPYAALAALLVAKDNVDANEIEKAVSQLKWVIENNNSDAVLHIAQQRLARAYLSIDDIASAEALVKGVKVEGYAAGYDEIRGDINLAKNLPVQAKENYRLALSMLSQGDQRFAIVKMKLDDLTQANKVK